MQRQVILTRQFGMRIRPFARLVRMNNRRWQRAWNGACGCFNLANLLHDMRPSLVAWWQFEPSNTRIVLDASGNHFDGNLTGDAQIIADLERGHVLSLQGNGYVVFADNQILPITGPMTLSCWIKAKVISQYRNAIIDDGKSLDGNETSCTLRSPGLIFVKYSGLTCGIWPGLVGRGNLLDKKWHHVAATYDNTAISLYIDGRLDSSKLATGFMTPSAFPVCIGANCATKRDRFTGLLDDIRIYNYALSESEITALCAGQRPPGVENGDVTGEQ